MVGSYNRIVGSYNRIPGIPNEAARLDVIGVKKRYPALLKRNPLYNHASALYPALLKLAK